MLFVYDKYVLMVTSYMVFENQIAQDWHTTEVPKGCLNKDEVDVFLCKLSSIPPYLAHTLAWTDATENVPNLTRVDFVLFKTFASKD